MRLQPLGVIRFDLSLSADVTGYRGYFALEAETLAIDGFDYNRPYIEATVNHIAADPDNGVEEQHYGEFNLSDIDADLLPGMQGDATIYLAAVSVDDAGNLSDPSEPIAIAIDVEAPLPPTNLRYVTA